MRYLVTLKVAAQPDGPPPADLMEAIFKLGQEATEAGALLDQSGLAPSSEGARVEVSGGRLAVSDGPFAEAKEMISYALYEVKTKEEAVEWTSRFIKLHRDLWLGWEGQADVLRLFSPADFAPPA
ncbi:YciI family protein [Nonomuraea turcica]|uniref:YciI family protein n=1 Tax=Nonomuraea sp. G32 TaxID=3067274 RepID=UPI00273BD1B3|nr:YciI family protein [Nonomuraea sp. G32]MDP4508790.1 YciI family protein [Nonomuraea sp. G32]